MSNRGDELTLVVNSDRGDDERFVHTHTHTWRLLWEILSIFPSRRK